MKDSLLQRTTEYREKRHRMKRWQKIVTVLSAVVVFCTTYALILPAITMEGKTYCGYEEHLQHSEEDGCYEETKTLTCDLSESNGHQHTDTCYETCDKLICSIPESAGHVHETNCYDAEGNLVCGMAEGEGAHTHDSSCHTTETVLKCQLTEGEGHQHTDACYTVEQKLVCKKTLHEHTLQCHSNPEADVEDSKTWEESFSRVELTGNWDEDVIAIAKTQLGYTESKENYSVTEDETKKGYTRYGDWYGDPYGDWCAMFASFCLHYAEVDPEVMPVHANCNEWIKELSKEEYGIYQSADTYEPKPGDLIFFDWDEITDINKRDADHVGIVAETEYTDSKLTEIKTIEGNSSDCVQFVTYEADDLQILGYGALPENPDLKSDEVDTYGTNALADDGTEVVLSDSGVVLSTASDKNVSGNAKITWNSTEKKVEEFSVTATSSSLDNAWFYVQYSDDGQNWSDGVKSETTIRRGDKTTLNALSLLNEENTKNASKNRQYRVYAYKDNRNAGYTITFTLQDLFESSKSGFESWLENNYVQDFGGTAVQTQADLINAFAVYEELPTATIQSGLQIEDGKEKIVLSATLDKEILDVTYQWEYYDETSDEWKSLTNENSNTIDATSMSVLNGGADVRCKVYSGEQIQTVSNILNVNNSDLSAFYTEAIQEINTGLNLGDLAINGTQFTNYFYYGNVAADDRVPFEDAKTYASYLAQTYLVTKAASGETDALATVKSIWNRYLYDLYTPSKDQGKLSNYSDYPKDTYGDGGLEWPKDSISSFHGNAVPRVNDLSYDFLENGVDYSNFITGLDKTATADAAGDENEERKYDIDITADAQAKARGPVAMVLQIQTSWQMFDLLHANAVKGEGDTEVGAAAQNTELANLYAIKQALLRFVDYMETNYPGNNLVLGITEVQHGGTYSMFKGTDAKGNDLYVTNDYDALREGILGWDTFGNCEHVHYRSNELENAVENLSSNLYGWKNFDENFIKYENIQKVGVIIGGPTENSASTNGYQCTLPWSSFTKAGLNSVYGIRTNVGTGNLSWLDYSGNTSGTPYVDGTGTAFTQKYVASTEDAVFNTLVKIALEEMNKKGIEITAEDKYVENVTVSDTVSDEFMIDTSEPITATIYNKDGSVMETKTVELSNPNLMIQTNEDGTTDVTYNFGTVYNTKKCTLHFGVVAKEDYIGSNNVFTNKGTPDLTYVHKKTDNDGNLTGEEDSYDLKCTDTPEVNVPIRFSTVDGERITVKLGESAELANLSEEIVKDAEDRVDNYDQIDGTLSYKWVLPDGTEVKAGSVTVADGSIGEANFPDRSCMYTPPAADIYEAVLEVTFTPNTVSDNGNFSNDVTKTAVNELTKPGSVWIEAVDAEKPTSLYVKKVWNTKDNEPVDIESVDFKLLADGKPAVDADGQQITGTLNEGNNWTMKIDNLPTATNDGKIIQYSVLESPVPDGYSATYSSEIHTDEEYSAKIKLTFTPKEAINNKKTVVIKYYYNGNLMEYTLAKQKYKANQSYDFELKTDLPLDAKNEPYSVSFDSVWVDNAWWVGGKDDTPKYTGSASAEPYLSGKESSNVVVITNTPATTVLTVKKQVTGIDTTQKFAFTATLKNGEFPVPEDGARYTIDENGVAHFSLADGESVTLIVPLDAEVTITEANPDGFYPLIKQGEVTVADGNSATVEINGDTEITVINTAGYELPDSGGLGTHIYILGGLVLMTAALIYSLSMRRRRGRRES